MIAHGLISLAVYLVNYKAEVSLFHEINVLYAPRKALYHRIHNQQSFSPPFKSSLKNVMQKIRISPIINIVHLVQRCKWAKLLSASLFKSIRRQNRAMRNTYLYVMNFWVKSFRIGYWQWSCKTEIDFSISIYHIELKILTDFVKALIVWLSCALFHLVYNILMWVSNLRSLQVLRLLRRDACGTSCLLRDLQWSRAQSPFALFLNVSCKVWFTVWLQLKTWLSS